MAGRKGQAGGQDGRRHRGRRASVREGGTALTVGNSGLEVWRYDDANRDAIRAGDASDPGFGGMPPGDYGLTLYRIDRETLDREGLTVHHVHGCRRPAGAARAHPPRVDR